MNLENQYRCLIESYYGIMELDEYALKEYVLRDIEKRIRDFIKEHKKIGINYREEADFINDNVPLVTKLQSSLITLNNMDVPMELILLIKKRIKELNGSA